MKREDVLRWLDQSGGEEDSYADVYGRLAAGRRGRVRSAVLNGAHFLGIERTDLPALPQLPED